MLAETSQRESERAKERDSERARERESERAKEKERARRESKYCGGTRYCRIRKWFIGFAEAALLGGGYRDFN